MLLANAGDACFFLTMMVIIVLGLGCFAIGHNMSVEEERAKRRLREEDEND
jgi:hypothetical protein